MFFKKKDIEKKGYTVDLKELAYISYSEEHYKARIDVELMQDTTIVVYFSSFESWLSDGVAEKISPDHKGRVKNNIEIELIAKGWVLDWD